MANMPEEPACGVILLAIYDTSPANTRPAFIFGPFQDENAARDAIENLKHHFKGTKVHWQFDKPLSLADATRYLGAGT